MRRTAMSLVGLERHLRQYRRRIGGLIKTTRQSVASDPFRHSNCELVLRFIHRGTSLRRPRSLILRRSRTSDPGCGEAHQRLPIS